MPPSISGPSSILPERDFPEACRALYPEDFVYPEGYLASPSRVADPAVLQDFAAWMRPYMVRSHEGELMMDPHVPVPVRRLAQGNRDTTIQSALRYLEWNGPPDEALKATFALEDMTEEAELCSEAGRHREALAMIRGMPTPFQTTSSALRSLVRSLKAMGRYAEALEECGRLIKSDNITDYARDLYRILEAELLLHCDRPEEAGEALSRRRDRFQMMWPYYGVRAALALRAGDEELAKALILRAGKVDAFHCYKLLWNRHLAPLADFIRRELLTDDGKPRLYERNSKMRRLCHAIHGALLTGDMERARNLAEGLQTQHVTDWDSGHQFVLALIGLGYCKWAESASAVLPRADLGQMALIRAVAQCIETPGDSVIKAFEEVEEYTFSPDGRRHFMDLLPWLSRREGDPLPPLSRCVVADVAPAGWGDLGRDHFVVLHDPHTGFEAWRVFQDRSVHRPSPWRLLELFPVQERISFPSNAGFESWLESRLELNVGTTHPYGRKSDVDYHGWALCTLLHPDAQKTPLMAEAVKIMCGDPSLYFSNGPAASFGMQVPFGDRLVRMIRCCLRSRLPAEGQ